jgi:hypothetical protein
VKAAGIGTIAALQVMPGLNIDSGSKSVAPSDFLPPDPAAETDRNGDPQKVEITAEHPESASTAQDADVRSGTVAEPGADGALFNADSRNTGTSEPESAGALVTDAPRLSSRDAADGSGVFFVPDASSVSTAPGDADGALSGVSALGASQPESGADLSNDHGGSLPASIGGSLQLGLEQPTVSEPNGAPSCFRVRFQANLRL